MRIRDVAIATTLFILSTGGCTWAQNPLSFGSSTTQPKNFTALMDDVQHIHPSVVALELREFKNRLGPSATEKQEAAYILGRLIQAHTELAMAQNGAGNSDSTSQPGSTAPGTATGGAMDEAMALFYESASFEALHQKSLAHALDCAMRANNEAVVRKILQQQRDETKDTLKQVSLDYALAQSFLRTQEYDSALPILQKIRTAAPDSNFAFGSGYYLGDAALKGQNPAMTPAEAVECFRAYLRNNPDGRFARDIVSALTALAASANSGGYTPTVADHELFGQVYFASGNYRSALTEWDHAAPGSKTAQKAICLARTGQLAEAKQLLLTGIQTNPNLSYATAADIISQPLTREQTRQFWLQILAAKPKKADTALWNVGVRAEAPLANDCYRKLIAQYPTSEFAPEAMWWLFWNHAKLAPKDPTYATTALNIASEGVAKYPETRAGERLTFWMGKLHELQKKPQLAMTDYRSIIAKAPSSYYSYRARGRMCALAATHLATAGPDAAIAAPPHVKDPGWSTFPDRQDVPANWSWPRPEQISTTAEIQKQFGSTVAELFKLRQFDECIEALPSDAGPEFKSALLADDGQPLPAINAATRGLKGAAHHSTRWQLAYPLVYAETIKSEANAKKVDPYLVHALIREESRYHHHAISRSHAIGLMQLLPGTAQGVAKRLGVGYSSNEDFFKPEINIKLGTDYLSYVLGRYSGNALMAVASYNGGPNAVKGWLRAHEDNGMGDYDYFVENIPMRETRDYVRKVFGAYWNYLTVYGAAPMSNLLQPSALENRRS